MIHDEDNQLTISCGQRRDQKHTLNEVGCQMPKVRWSNLLPSSQGLRPRGGFLNLIMWVNSQDCCAKEVHG